MTAKRILMAAICITAAVVWFVPADTRAQGVDITQFLLYPPEEDLQPVPPRRPFWSMFDFSWIRLPETRWPEFRLPRFRLPKIGKPRFPKLPAAPALPRLHGPENLEFGVGLKTATLRNRTMEESGGLPNPDKYRHYRFSSGRWLLSGSAVMDRRYGLALSIGQTDLTAHSSEGESVAFDRGTAFGVEGALRVLEVPDINLSLLASASLLKSALGDDRVTRVQDRATHRDYSTGGDLSAAWTEWVLALKAMYEAERCNLSAGVRYSSVTMDQERELNGTTYDSSFDAGNVGFLLAAEYELLRGLFATFRFDFPDESTMTFGIKYGL